MLYHCDVSTKDVFYQSGTLLVLAVQEYKKKNIFFSVDCRIHLWAGAVFLDVIYHFLLLSIDVYSIFIAD